MRVRWTGDAADDLERISDYISEDRPDAARRIALHIVRTSMRSTRSRTEAAQAGLTVRAS
jgi:plasmid stabilization system protein ParE